MLDLIIENGLIIDGTGNPGYYAAVGVEGDSLKIFRGNVSSVERLKTIDAAGYVVCPGFIDIHAHSALMVLANPLHEPKIRQGVTTELIGIDGNSYAPFRSVEDLKSFIELNAGLEGKPSLTEFWSTVEQYLEMFDRKVSPNIAYILGNSPIRINAVGWEDSPATNADLENMKSIVREAMQEGAFGMSTGLDYPPGSYADTDELITLSKEVANLGGIYHTHLRYKLGDRFLDPIREALDIGRASGVPVHITHVSKRNDSPGGTNQMLAIIEDAHRNGQDITFDSVPLYPGSTRLIALLPEWTHNGGPKRIKEFLRSKEYRKQLREEIHPPAVSWQDVWLTYFKQPNNRQYEGISVSELAIMRDQHPVDVICELLLEEDLQTSFNAMSSSLQALPALITHPLSMIGSDAVLLGDFPPPRSYGTFPSILAEYVREEQLMTISEGIRKMTSLPAQRLGILDRGILRDGMKADIVVLDPKTISAPTTRTYPKRFPIGIQYVMVNGSIVIEKGSHTGNIPGRALKHGRV